MKETRSGKAIRNTFCQLALEVVTAVCGLILPRLILSRFGSSYNGITQSITQFISCIALLKSGIGSVTRAALYKPLANHNATEISEVTNATEKYMRRVACIFSVFVIGFAAVYPFIVSNDFDWFFAFSLVLILSISTVAQYFFGITYQMLIEADQNNYIISLTQIVSTVLNTLISSLLILAGFGIHIVKLGSAIVFVFPPLFYSCYAKRKYHIDKKVPANESLISQRWDAFGHQLANFINNNTDVIVTTVFLGVKEVSVYSVYNMIGGNLKKVVNAFSSGTTAAFGNMLAKNEFERLRIRFRQYEILIFLISTVLFGCAWILYIPFVSIYTSGVNDANYVRYTLALFFCLAEFFGCVKLIYENIVFAAGRFTETKRMAYVEAGINIVISLILVNVIGLGGILVGTVVAGIYRTLMYNYFVSKNIIERSAWGICQMLIYSFLCFAVCSLISSLLPLSSITNYLQWLLYACVVFAMEAVVSIALGLLFFRNDFVDVLKLLLSKLHRNRA